MTQDDRRSSARHDRTAPRQALRTVRATLPHGLIERQGEVVGCWYVTDVYRPRRTQKAPVAPVHVQVDGVLRVDRARIVGVQTIQKVGPHLRRFMETELLNASIAPRLSDRREAAASFVRAMRGIVDTLEDSEDLFFECTYPKIEEHVGAFAPEEGRDACRVVLGEREAVLRRFAETLDPAALLLLRARGRSAASRVFRHDLDELLGEAWPMLDITFSGRASSRAAVSLALQTDSGLAVEHLRSRLGRGTHWDDIRELMSEMTNPSAGHVRDQFQEDGPQERNAPSPGQ